MRLLPLLIGFILQLLAVPSFADPAKFAASVRKISVLVLTGHELEVARLGLTVFGNERFTHTLDSDRLSDLIHREIEAHLISERKYDVSRFTLSRDQRALLAEKLRDLEPWIFPFKDRAIAELLQSGVSSCSCDALLIVTGRPTAYDPALNQRYKPLAWVARSFSDKIARTTVLVAHRFHLVEVSSSLVVASQPLHGIYPRKYTKLDIDPEKWPINLADLTEEHWQLIETRIAMEIHLNARRGLFDLGLRPSCTLYYGERELPQGPRFQREGRQPPKLPPMPEGSDPSWCLEPKEPRRA